jgi:DNA-binding LacI/PurR family transcriptional regulator
MKKKTINDIAREAGVSKATVSRVLTRPELVNDRTRKHILSIMEKHSYIPNQLARGLAGTLTRTIGVVIDELSNDFYIEVAEGVDSVINAHDYSMQLSSSRWIPQREQDIVRSLISSRVDGILLAPVASSSKSMDLLKASGIPFIVFNCIPDDPDVAYVTCDNISGGKLAASYINDHERDQTIVITGFDHQSLDHRLQGFRSTLRNGEKLTQYEDVKTFQDGLELIPILVTRNKIDRIPTTLFVTNDNVAIGIIHGLLERGITVPGQVSVLGYDNIRMSSFSQIPLTTISQSIRDMGRIAAIELLEMISDSSRPLPKHLISPQLFERKSY